MIISKINKKIYFGNIDIIDFSEDPILLQTDAMPGTIKYLDDGNTGIF
jgi:hypothetical protein